MEETQIDRPTTVRSHALGYGLLLVTFLVTLLAYVPFGTGILAADKKVVLAIGVFITFIIWLISGIKDLSYEVPKSGIIKASFGVLVVTLLATIFSQNPSASLAGVGYEMGTFLAYSIMFILMLLSASFFQDKKRSSGIFTILMLAFFLVYVVQILNLIFGWTFGIVGAGSGANLIGSWNDLGIFAGLIALISVIYLEFFKVNSTIRNVASLALLLSATLIILVNFSTLWWVIGIGALLMLLSRLFGRKADSATLHTEGQPHEGGEAAKPAARKRNIPLAALIVLALSILFIIFGRSGGFLETGVGKVAPTPLEVRPSLRGTFSVIGPTLKSDPILGVGPNLFSRKWNLHKPIAVNEGPFWNIDFNQGYSHIVSTIVTHGILGAIAWLLFLIALIVTALKALRNKELSGPAKMPVMLAGLSTLYLWLFSLIYTPSVAIVALTYLMTGIFVATLVSAGMGQNYALKREGGKGRSLVTIFAVVLLLLGLTGGYMSLQKHRAFTGYAATITELSLNNDPAAAIESLDKVVSIDRNDLYLRELANQRLSHLARDIIGQDLNEESVATAFLLAYEEVVEAATEALEYDTTNYLNHVRLGDVFEVSCYSWY